MHWSQPFAIVAGWLLATSATFAAGIQALNVPADGPSPAFSGAVWYPCALPPTELHMGPFVVTAAKDCPVAGMKLPLIVMSHGRAGTFLGHRDTAQALADAGCIVAAISHPGDNALDSSSSNEPSVFIRRPADIKRLVDYLLGTWSSAAHIDAERIGFFGFSRGGYTGLALAGAVPRSREGKSTPVAHDPRIKAAVIADPLTLFFAPDAFAAIRIPIQLWQSEHGGDGVTPEGVAAVAAGLPAKPEFHPVPGAGHFAFLPPCPQAIRQSAPEICTDAAGFDRKAFHETFNAQVVEFFRRTLP